MDEFQATLRNYVQYNKREFPRICNTKAYRIAIVACAKTHKAERANIIKGISQIVWDIKRTKSGRGKRVLKLWSGTAGGVFNKTGAPVGALIVNFLRGKRGEKGLYGSDMKRAIERLVTQRFSAIAYLASGWLPAIKKLASLADRGSKTVALPSEINSIKSRMNNPYLGSVIPAVESEKPFATIINTAESKYSTTKDPLQKFGLPALQYGVDVETASMLQYIADKLTENAHQLRIRTN